MQDCYFLLLYTHPENNWPYATLKIEKGRRLEARAGLGRKRQVVERAQKAYENQTQVFKGHFKPGPRCIAVWWAKELILRVRTLSNEGIIKLYFVGDLKAKKKWSLFINITTPGSEVWWLCGKYVCIKQSISCQF